MTDFIVFLSLWVLWQNTTFQLVPPFQFLHFLHLLCLHDLAATSLRRCQDSISFFLPFSLPSYWEELELETISSLSLFTSVLPDLWAFPHSALTIRDICRARESQLSNVPLLEYNGKAFTPEWGCPSLPICCEKSLDLYPTTGYKSYDRILNYYKLFTTSVLFCFWRGLSQKFPLPSPLSLPRSHSVWFKPHPWAVLIDQKIKN